MTTVEPNLNVNFRTDNDSIEGVESYSFSELGVSGLKHSHGYVHEEFLTDLQGERGIRVWREMSSNDPVVGAVLFGIDMLVRQVEWNVESASESPEDVAAAEFVKQCIGDMSHSWEDFISEVLTMLPYGFSAFEIVLKQRGGLDAEESWCRSKYNDGRVGWRKFAPRAQDSLARWIFDPEDGATVGWVQQPPPDYKERVIPMEKALLFRTVTHRQNPEGRSVLRNAYRPWYFKKRIEEIEGIGIERDLAGLPVAWVPPNLLSDKATAAERNQLAAFKRVIRRVRRDQEEGLVLPLDYTAEGHKRYDFQLMSTGGSRAFSTDAIIARYDQRIAMVALADFILLGHEKVGSFSLSSDKTDMFATSLGALMRSIAGVLNRYAIPRLFEVNTFRVDELPKVSPGDLEKPPVLETLTAIKAMVESGFVGISEDEKVENYLRRLLGVPTTGADDDEVSNG